MRLLTAASAALLTAAASGMVTIRTPRIQTYKFAPPIDALSVGIGIDEPDLWVSARTGSAWTAWEGLSIERGSDPFSYESNLVLFPQPVSVIRIRGREMQYALHPIRISREPIHFAVAARGSIGTPRILSRKQWGADESLTYADETAASSDRADIQVENGDTEIPKRVQDCQEAQQNYPKEFRTVRTIRTDRDGRQYRWPRRYSPEIHHLVIHHTAQKVRGDPRSPVERMRALYEYHAKSRGWGDVGYHYVIDENGQIYEGRAGGDYVVGGHVYCGNVGTIGIALMGDFEVEQPTHAQTSSLKWLLAELANKYQMNLRRTAVFHGAPTPPIVGHGDLSPTAGPGYYLRNAISTIRKHVLAGNYSAKIAYPSTERTMRARRHIFPQSNLSPFGKTELTGRPGGLLYISLQYQPMNGIQKRGRIATIARSNSTIGLWQNIGGHYARVRKELIAPKNIRSGETETIRMRVQLPRTAGLYTVDVGSTTYVFKAEGRRVPSPKTLPTRQSYSPEQHQNVQTPGFRRMQEYKTHPQETRMRTTAYATNHSAHTIRIRLSYENETATVETTTSPLVNGVALNTRQFSLLKKGFSCALLAGNNVVESGVVRVNTGNSTFTISSWKKPENRFRGTLECRVMFGKLVFINELPLEDYLAGVSEEPDSEPFEKQRAFAIAARSYAAYYTDPANRKFAGMPYDGSDTGKNFQNYGGYVYERNNPRWVRAVHETKGLVVKKLNRIVKAAYFSSSDGRTRSPEENGWENFPFAEVFRSKPDPWCQGQVLRGHGVGMSGCGARGQAEEGNTAEEILRYYYPGTRIETLNH